MGGLDWLGLTWKSGVQTHLGIKRGAWSSLARSKEPMKSKGLKVHHHVLNRGTVGPKETAQAEAWVTDSMASGMPRTVILRFSYLHFKKILEKL